MHHELLEGGQQVHDQVLLAQVDHGQVVLKELHQVQLNALVGPVREEVVVLDLNE